MNPQSTKSSLIPLIMVFQVVVISGFGIGGYQIGHARGEIDGRLKEHRLQLAAEAEARQMMRDIGICKYVEQASRTYSCADGRQSMRISTPRPPT